MLFNDVNYFLRDALQFENHFIAEGTATFVSIPSFEDLAVTTVEKLNQICNKIYFEGK